MKKIAGAVGLALLALFMLAGFLNSDTDVSAGARLLAFAITVVLPAAGALLLVRGHYREKSRLSGRRALLARHATESELLRLAQGRGGKLMAVEAALALHLAEDVARETLDTMVSEGRAELEVTDGGNLVYSFPTLTQLSDKRTARGILDA
jgi:dsDNA-specific endonuclease/ATPase MutS2